MASINSVLGIFRDLCCYYIIFANDGYYIPLSPLYITHSPSAHLRIQMKTAAYGKEYQEKLREIK